MKPVCLHTCTSTFWRTRPLRLEAGGWSYPSATSRGEALPLHRQSCSPIAGELQRRLPVPGGSSSPRHPWFGRLTPANDIPPRDVPFFPTTTPQHRFLSTISLSRRIIHHTLKRHLAFPSGSRPSIAHYAWLRLLQLQPQPGAPRQGCATSQSHQHRYHDRRLCL